MAFQTPLTARLGLPGWGVPPARPAPEDIGELMSTVVVAVAAEAADVTARHAYELLTRFARVEREGPHTRRGYGARLA